MADVTKYLDRVTSQHRRPRFLATIDVSTQPFAALRDLLVGVPTTDYDLDTAEGSQLDVLGEWLGVGRTVSISLGSIFFSFNIDGLGFNQGFWSGSAASGTVLLTDDVYRKILKYRALLLNKWDGTVEAAYEAWAEVFDGESSILIQDHGDMTMTVSIGGVRPDAVTFKLFEAGYYDPKPAGVRVKRFVPSGDGPAFGWGLDNEFIAGWGEGRWVQPP